MIPYFVEAISFRFEYSIQLADEFGEFAGVFDGNLLRQLPPAFLGFGALDALPPNLKAVWEELVNIIYSGDRVWRPRKVRIVAFEPSE